MENSSVIVFKNHTKPTEKCDLVLDIYDKRIEIALASVGFVFNLICVWVFVQLIRGKSSKSDMFKYLLVKSICDSLYSFRMILKFIFNYQAFNVEKYFVWQLIQLLILYYFGFIVQLVTVLCDIAATFNRFRTITQKFKFMNKFSYLISIVGFFAYASMFYSHKFFEHNIQKVSIKNSTESNYLLNSNEHFEKNYQQIFGLIHSLVRDGLCVAILLLLNILLLIYLKNTFKKKKQMLSLKKNEKKERAEMKITLMIISTGIISIISHGVLLYSYIERNRVSKCALFAIYFIYDFAFCINILIYLLFNKNFNRYLYLALVKCFKGKCWNRNKKSHEQTTFTNY
jgi:hypothetical protein